MLQVEPRAVAEDQARVLRHGAGAVAGEAGLALARLQFGDEALEVLGREVRGRDEHHARARHRADGHHVLQRIEGHLHDLRRLGQHVARGHHDGVAVGRRLQHGLQADGAARAGAVLDDHGAADVQRHLLPDDAGDDVHRAARRRGNDELDGLVAQRPGPEGHRASDQRHGGGACKLQQFHGVSPVVVLQASVGRCRQYPAHPVRISCFIGASICQFGTSPRPRFPPPPRAARIRSIQPPHTPGDAP
ncbi:hypothetical protein D3C72_1102970 [compost metagenome]